MPDFTHLPDADDDVVDRRIAAELEERCRDLEARVASAGAASSARAFRVLASVVYRGGGYTLLLDTPDGLVVVDADPIKTVAVTEVVPDLPGDETPAALRARQAFLRQVGERVLGGAVPVDVFDSALETMRPL